MTTSENSARKRKIMLERSYQASLEEVWEMWTTKEGLEAWWGPDGFAVTVQKLELVVGGDLHYTMTAVAPPQIEYMKQHNMPLSTPCRVKYVEVSAPRRLVYSSLVDFAPGTAAYDVDTVLELRAEGDTVHLKLILDAMHDEGWTSAMVEGWVESLRKLPAASV